MFPTNTLTDNTHRSEAPASQRRPVLAYLAPRFPERSETFVYREILSLRQAGWQVFTNGLHRAQTATTDELKALAAETSTVYGSGWPRLLRDALAEGIAHPVLGLKTLGRALADAIVPGEPLSAAGRAKLLPQAVAGMAFARRLRANRVEHLHAHFAHATASVAMYAAGQADLPFSFTGHANDLFQRRCLLKRKLSRAAFVACISRWHQQFYASQVPDPTNARYPIVRCAVDVDAWAPRGQAEPPAADAHTILFVGRLVEKKGADTLIEAVANLRRDGRKIRLTVAGDGPERTRLEALAKQVGLDQEVDWQGAVDNERVRHLMAAAQIFALPCRTDSQGDRDGIPVVLMEAMACGLPAVSGDLPAIRELIENGRSGLLVPGNDVRALTSALKTLVSDRALSASLANAGREAVRREFSREVNLQRLESAFFQAAPSTRRKPAR